MPTISEQLTQLISDRDDLVDNLTTKGISGLTGDETFTELVPEVLNISGGGSRDWSEIGYSEEPQAITDGFNYAKQIYDNWDSSQTSYFRLYRANRELIIMPLVDTFNSSNFQQMFSNCSCLIQVPSLNTSNGTVFEGIFQSCGSLKCVEQLNFSKAKNVTGMFQSCNYLKKLGGLLNLGQAYSTLDSANYSLYTLTLSSCALLTHDSLINVINGLYDIATKGCNAQQLVLGSTNLAKLTAEEISTCTSKGWSVS